MHIHQSRCQPAGFGLKSGPAASMVAEIWLELSPDIAEPMRSWSMGATAMWAKMGLRVPGKGLYTTATGMNDNATRVQEACAAAGTHA